jgi:hypothetical protein
LKIGVASASSALVHCDLPAKLHCKKSLLQATQLAAIAPFKSTFDKVEHATATSAGLNLKNRSRRDQPEHLDPMPAQSLARDNVAFCVDGQAM